MSCEFDASTARLTPGVNAPVGTPLIGAELLVDQPHGAAAEQHLVAASYARNRTFCAPHGELDAKGRCLCVDGYDGERCNRAVCLSNDCNRQGTCVEGACSCYRGFFGLHCENRVSTRGSVVPTLVRSAGDGIVALLSAQRKMRKLIHPPRSLIRLADEKSRHVRGSLLTLLQYSRSAHDAVMGAEAAVSALGLAESLLVAFPSDAALQERRNAVDFFVSEVANFLHALNEKVPAGLCPADGAYIGVIPRPGVCHGHGKCACMVTHDGPDCSCLCDIGWGGADCGMEECLSDCHGHGTCSGGKCACKSGWTGAWCHRMID